MPKGITPANKSPEIPFGTRFGMLVVEKLAAQDGYHVCYWVTCDCGGRTVVRGAQLRRGAVKSCGCQRQRAKVEYGKRMARTFTFGKRK